MSTKPDLTQHPPAAARVFESSAASLSEVLDALLEVLEQETQLVRAGHLGKAGDLQAAKSALTTRYIAEAQQLKTTGKPPPRSAAHTALRVRHERLHSLLQANLTVLATAHAVAEGLVRGAAAELTRKQSPQTYGPGGYAARPPARAAQPVMLNRSL